MKVVALSVSSLLTAPKDSPVTALLCPSYVLRHWPERASQALIVASLDPVRKVTLSIASTDARGARLERDSYNVHVKRNKTIQREVAYRVHA